jgi:hypothetical protein
LAKLKREIGRTVPSMILLPPKKKRRRRLRRTA